MEIKPEPNCPLDGFKPCRKLGCGWFLEIRGNNPNTGADISEWGCAMAWQPILTIENSNMQRQTGAAIESFRNEMVKANHATLSLVAEQKLIEGSKR